MSEQTELNYKRINNASETKERLKIILIGHVIFWVVFGIIILIFGDINIALATNPGFTVDETYWFYKIIKIYTDMFMIIQLGTIVAVILCLSIPKWKPYRRPMLEAFYSVVMAGIFIESLKTIIGRPRPFQEGSPIKDQINNFNEPSDAGSMPSGHVGYTGAALLPHALRIKNLAISIIISVFNVGMMYTRMYLGIHFATDVLVANMISLGCAIGSFFLFQQIYKKGTIKHKHEWIIFIIGLLIFVATFVLLK